MSVRAHDTCCAGIMWYHGINTMCADEKHNLSVRGLFYGIGHQPNSGFLQDQLKMDDAGYVVVSPSLSQQNWHLSAPGLHCMCCIACDGMERCRPDTRLIIL